MNRRFSTSHCLGRPFSPKAPCSWTLVLLTALATTTGLAHAAPAQSDDIAIEKIETVEPDAPAARADAAWLGVSASEASEALSAQLDLPPGVGLVVNFVAPESPAAKAGLRKNDVLTQFQDQSLVHPAQLRKLVQARKPGDEIRLAFYRGGKSETLTVALANAPPGSAPFDMGDLRGSMQQLRRQLQDLHINEAVREQMKNLDHSLGDLKIDQKKLQFEIRRSMEEAGHAVQEALRNVTNADSALGPIRKTLEELARAAVSVQKDATVTVRSAGHHGVKSLVQADDSGTIILIRNPKLHLTAHDKTGKLLFDGEIETADQRASVPRHLWERVEPLLDKLGSADAESEERQ